MESIWGTQEQPLLTKLVAGFDHGQPQLDTAAYAAVLNMTAIELDTVLELLAAARFFTAERRHGGWLITSICPLTRQIVAHKTSEDTGTPQHTLAWSVVAKIQRDYHPAGAHHDRSA